MFKKGTQIIYVPYHAHGDRNHPDCEKGFVARNQMNRGVVACRYWLEHKGEMHLRTKANSELTPAELLVKADSVPQIEVDEAIEEYNI